MLTPSVGQLWRLLTDLIFPPRCVGCRRMGTLLCQGCVAGIARFAAPRCARCDLPLATPARLGARCAACRQGQLPHLDGMRVVGPHVEPLRSAIHALKYSRRTAIAAPLGALLAEQWLMRPPGPLDGLVPVPLHPDRQRERGFNQSALLAEPMALALGAPVRADLLQRTRATRPQVGLARGERLQNVAGAFEAAPEAAGGHWLLVDDVCTTGATLSAGAEALRAQGARTVWAVTLARPHPT